jgi:hypothetical protein
MAHSLNQYFVNINTGVPYPYYDQKSYLGDNGDTEDLDDYKVPAGSNYPEIFKKLIEMEHSSTPNYEETNARALCSWMLQIEKQKNEYGRVDKYILEEFKMKLDQYFARKAWSFDNLSELQVLQRQLAKVAVDLYKRNKR